MAQYRLGTRSSQLAVAQTEAVRGLLEQRGHQADIVTMETKGDRILSRPLHEVGGKGLFTEELERALLHRDIDLAVHSLKDLPTMLAPGLSIGAYLLPEDRRDVLVAAAPLSEWRAGMAIGTSSLRRTAFLRRLWPTLEVRPIRGNLNTRMAKWRQGDVDGLVLAAAGVIRLGWESEIIQYLDPDEVVPSPGQGILAVEVASDRTDLTSLLEAINDPQSAAVAIMERAVLDELGGGCQVPLGAFAQWSGAGRLHLTAQVASLDGGVLLRETADGRSDEAESVGRAVGQKLRAQGALTFIQTQEG